ncbi:virulence-associated protein [Roseibium sp. TrichSKD4]|uniref:DUF4815 domain-containing protein n=1 Tax=Roseibium sp. TrichSKD4 TaxID=744980 RepID=UPI0001E5707D|nr:DUF4815 domain-containing protein [Roseibium sp. TrichSKD4]EFO31682.1 virulence-associated protein [Roseibium sp. TrichSKD4]
MAFEHPELPNTYDRSPEAPANRTRVEFIDGRHIEGGDINEVQGLFERSLTSVAKMSAANGDIREGAGIKVELITDPATPNEPATHANITLQAGVIFVDRDLEVKATYLENVPITGQVSVGVRKLRGYVTSEQDETLKGIAEGEPSFNEPGHARREEDLVWALPDDDQAGEFTRVYQLRDGVVVDKKMPVALSRIIDNLRIYDSANGSYIVEGCDVRALGSDGEGHQVLSIDGGIAHIDGFRRTRDEAFTLFVEEDPDLEDVPAETHQFDDPDGTGSATIEINRPPVASVTSALVTKQITIQRARGDVPNGLDQLDHGSVRRIISVTQSDTVYVEGTDFELSGDDIRWLLGGNQPDAQDTYSVTYLYYAPADSIAFDNRTITITGGVNGEDVLLTYRSKIPRRDLLVLDISGQPRIIKGVSMRRKAVAPPTPPETLPLAEIHNDWFGAPLIVSSDQRMPTVWEDWQYKHLLLKLADQFNRMSMESSVPDSVSADGIFTDDFQNDELRDNGVPQTAAINRGVLQLPVHEVMNVSFGQVETLAYEEKATIEQLLSTGVHKVNPYQNFNPIAGDLFLTPALDHWTEVRTAWTSPVTQFFTAAPGRPPGRTVMTEEVSQRTETASAIRQLDIAFTLNGFGANEQLESLLFAGRDVTPNPPLFADATGQITGSFRIPENVPPGSHAVDAKGAAGSFSGNTYAASLTITTEVMRRVNLVTRRAPPPTVINNITNVTNITEVNVRGGRRNGGDQNEPWQRSGDPIAWVFPPAEDGYNLGLDFWIGEVGNPDNPIILQLAGTVNGDPSNEIAADTLIPMHGVQPGDLIQARWRAPVPVSANRRMSYVWMTNDGDHAIQIARQGDVDPTNQQRVGGTPYPEGAFFKGANRSTWLYDPSISPKVRVISASFTESERRIELWRGELQAISDLVVQGRDQIPLGTGIRLELKRADGSVQVLQANQPIEFEEYVSEEVVLEAVLTGTKTQSPMMFGKQLIGGRLQQSADYVSRVFPLDGKLHARSLIKRFTPSGSSLAISVDKEDGVFEEMTPVENRPLGENWFEVTSQIDAFSAPHGGRIRITLQGTPAARPSVAELRAYPL